MLKSKKLKSLVLAALISFTGLSLAGCAESNVNMKVNQDGSGSMEYSITIDKSAVKMLNGMNSDEGKKIDIKTSFKQLIDKAKEVGYDGKLTTTKDKEGIIISKDYKDIMDINKKSPKISNNATKQDVDFNIAENKNFLTREKGLFSTKYKLHMKVTPQGDSSQGVSSSFNLTTPSKASSSNAEYKSGNKLTWDMTKSQYINAEFSTLNIKNIIISIIVIVVLIVLLVILVIKKKSGSKDAPISDTEPTSDSNSNLNADSNCNSNDATDSDK